MKHGSGIWRGSKNDSYIGEWKFGKPDGYGVHTWVNGKLNQRYLDLKYEKYHFLVYYRR